MPAVRGKRLAKDITGRRERPFLNFQSGSEPVSDAIGLGLNYISHDDGVLVSDLFCTDGEICNVHLGKRETLCNARFVLRL